MKRLPLALLAAAALAVPAARAADKGAASPRVVELTLTDAGLVPARVTLKKGEPVRIAFTRKTDRTCMFDIVIPEAGVKKAAPLNQTVAVEFTPTRSGSLKVLCGMGMQFGTLVVN